MKVVSTSNNRIKLESNTHFAVVSREYLGQPRKQWLLTAFEKKNSAFDNTMDTGETSLRGKQNDTATLQNTVSNSKDTTNPQTSNNLQQKIAQSYTITPVKYTTKRGKVLDMHLVKFAGTLTKEQQRAAKELAKAEKGWYDREQGGFMMRSEESANQLADTILNNDNAVSDAQPVSLADTRKVVKPQQVNVESLIGELNEKGEAKLSDHVEQPTNPSGNRLVTDERYAELRERMRKKLGGQMNIGIDPEILAIGTEMAVYHLEKGARKFTEYAKAMIADLGDAIRPYLKAFYNGARELPEVIETGLANDMTPYNEVQQFDVTNFDRTVADPIATAQTVARETEVTQEVETAKQRIKRSGEKKKSLPSQSNQLNLFDNDTRNEQNTRTDNSGTQPRREELPETESVEPGTPLQHTVKTGRSQRRNTRVSSSQSGDRPLYDVNKNYTNDEIKEIVSSVTDIVDDKVVITAPITDDIKAIARQYRSGGVAKKGRGILDEYYTDGKIVDAVNLIIAPYFKGKQPVRVLEPSIGIGNFIDATDGIPTSQVVAFEINDTTARIAKILYPQVDVNLRSFETEFIDETGNKKPLPQKFNLIIGNPPYGSHRGIYKGLGEESKIARYEDYFVKRSLDVLNDGGILAMVLPSSWIDRHTRFGGYTIEAAYRLPSGAFEATQVGTDIVVLRKDSTIPVSDHTPYFEQHPDRILGEIKQRKGRFGKPEAYVEGNIDTAIEAIKREQAERLASQLNIDPTNDNINDILSAIDETGSPEQATPIITQSPSTPAQQPAKAVENSKYKLSLNRETETVPTSLQFTHPFSEGEVEAFADTDYDGTISNPNQHRKYANYMGGRFVHDFYYAEGNIYDKLYQLEQEKEYIIKKYGQEQYDKQKHLLETVLPKRKGLDEITISPNTTFVKNLYVDTDKGSITLRDAFIDFCSKLPYQAFGDSSSWEVRGYVNNEQVYGQDKERNALVRERRKRVANDLFIKFLHEELPPEAQKQVVAAFNREYNSTYRPDYSRVPMFSTINKDFKGKPLKLTSVQLAGIGRMTIKGVGLLAHEVGFGKTLSGILAMHEAMTRGFATKPLIVVPNNNILEQWVETIKEVLPQATVNTLGNLGTSYDLTNFHINDGEFTIVTYEGLKAMSFSDDTYNRLAERFSYITEDLNKHQSERDIQKEIEKKKELKGKLKRGAKPTYNFEDFGFDWLTIDEVHNANHIVSKVRLDKSVASDFRSQSQRTSDLGLKTWLAAQYIQEENNGRNVLLLSATPFTNKPLEYYSILSLIANDMLRRKGFFNVDQFFETFMEADNDLEIAANGKPTNKTNIRRFRNNGLFQQLLSEFIDIKGEEDNPDLVRPNRINKEYKIAQNDLTADAIAAVQDLLNDNNTVLQGIGHARAAAFSPYATSLLGEKPRNYRDFVNNSPKIDATIKMIEQNKKDRPDAGQIIYSEVGVEYFPMIRDYLVNVSGFKPAEVRIITGATSNAERINIQTAFNKGEVKVVIGSPAIKEGLNLQENTTDMYILSLPWNFTQLRQIEGRGWRQGNKWENIRINYMLTNDSVDVFMLQRLQLKQGLYNEAMKSGAETLDVSDIDTAELKTALITDPATRAEIVTIQERAKLERQKTQIEADLSFILRKYESYNKLIEKLESQKKEINQFKEWADSHPAHSAYWANRVQYEENRLNDIVAEIQEEKERLQKKGVNVDDITRQTEQAQSAIKQIEEKIENLKEFREQLTEKYRKERQEKEEMQGDLLATYINERKAENKSGFYKIRPKDTPSAKSSSASRSDDSRGGSQLDGVVDTLPDSIRDKFSFRTSSEIEAEYPNWLDGTTTDSGKHSTQVEGTRKTYNKVADWIEQNIGKDVAILDASSGMGYGTADLRARGFNIEDVEPYQSDERRQNNPATYDSYDSIDKQYDYIISNAVLNVIPDDWRAGVLHDIATHLKPGGRIFINTRKAGEEKHIKDKIELDSPQEVLVKRNGRIASYQRFFTPAELREWVQQELGEGYTVEIANKANSGTNGLAAVVVTKNNENSIKDNIETLFYKALSGEFKGKPISIGRLTDAGKAYLEQVPGITFKNHVDFVLNPSDLVHIYKDHFGNNEKDKGQNIPLDIKDIRNLVDVISRPNKVVFFKEKDGSNRNMFYFFKEAEAGTYNLMEIYSDRKGNLTAKTFYKTKKDAAQRVMDIEKSLLLTSETYSGAILSDTNIPQIFDNSKLSDIRFRTTSPIDTARQVASQDIPRRIEQRTAALAQELGVPITVLHSNDQLRPLGDDYNYLADWLDGNIDGRPHRMAGMFSQTDNRLFVFAHNIIGTADPLAQLESTITHEVVAHYGLRKLLGEERLARFLDDVWQSMTFKQQLRWGRYAMNISPRDNLTPQEFAQLYATPAIQQKAAEEYIAHLSESGVTSPTLWQHICAAFRKIMRTLGLYSYTPTDADIRYILARSYNNLRNSPSAYSSPASRSEDRGGGRRPEGLNGEGIGDVSRSDGGVNSRGGYVSPEEQSIIDNTIDHIEQIGAEYDSSLELYRKELEPQPTDSPTDIARLPNNEEVIYRSEEITPEQSSLLERPNFAQYPTEQELSESKDTRNSLNYNYLERIIAQVESEVNTTPPRYKPPPPHNRPKDVCRRLWITPNKPPAQLGEQQPTNNNRLQRRETPPPNQTLRCSCDGELTPKTNFRTKKRISTRNCGTAERRSLHCRFKC